MRVVVLGASGQTGRHICRLLLQETRAEVVACGRSEHRLHELANQIADADETGALGTAQVDVNVDDGQLDDIIRSADIVVGATSHWYHGPRIAERAARSGVSYFGVYSSIREKWARLRRLQDICLENGVAVVDDGGAHPGLPGALVRLAAARGGVRQAWIGAKFHLKWSSLELAPETIEGFVSEIKDMDMDVYLEGRWVKGARYSRRFDFGEPFGSSSCIPMRLEEIRELADNVEGLTSTGFFISGFGPVVDYLVFPVAMVLSRLHPRTASRFVWWGLKAFEPSDQLGVVRLEAVSRDGTRIDGRVGPADPYILTAVPAVAALLQMQVQPRPGVWTQAAYVEPEAFFSDLGRMGLRWELSRDAL